MIHSAWRSREEELYCFSMSFIKFQGHTGRNIKDLNQILSKITTSVPASKSLRFVCFVDLLILCSTKVHAYLSWASCQIRKIAGAHAPGMPGTFSPSPQVSDPDMHHGTCVTHVPWCMPGSLTNGFLWNRRRGKTFPAFPAHAQPAILRIW